MGPRSFGEDERSLEIPREGVVQELTRSEIARITPIVFRPNEPRAADVMFLFGTHQCDWSKVASMYSNGLFPLVFVAGKVGPTWFEDGVPIAEHMRRSLIASGLPEDVIRAEFEATNTLEDVLFSLSGLVEKEPKSILFGAKAHHSGRCYLTLRRFFPEADLPAFTWPARYGEVLVEASVWPESEVARARVWGEYRRILAYSAKGDIASPEVPEINSAR